MSWSSHHCWVLRSSSFLFVLTFSNQSPSGTGGVGMWYSGWENRASSLERSSAALSVSTLWVTLPAAAIVFVEVDVFWMKKLMEVWMSGCEWGSQEVWYMDMTSETTSKCRLRKTINSHIRKVCERRRVHTRIVLKWEIRAKIINFNVICNKVMYSHL